MSKHTVVAGALISASIIIASLIDARKPDEKIYGLSASSKGVYVVDRRFGRVRYCLSLVDGSKMVFTKDTYREGVVEGKDSDVLRAAGFSEQEISDHIRKVEGKVEMKPDPDADYDDFPPYCTPWSSD